MIMLLFYGQINYYRDRFIMRALKSFKIINYFWQHVFCLFYRITYYPTVLYNIDLEDGYIISTFSSLRLDHIFLNICQEFKEIHQ